MSRRVVTSSHHRGLRLLCAAVALAAALCATLMTSSAPGDIPMSMPMTGSTASTSMSATTSTSVSTSTADHDRLAPVGCEGTCAGAVVTTCAASVLVALTLLPLVGRSRTALLLLGPRAPAVAPPPRSGRLLLARHVAAPSLLGVLRV